MTLECSLAEPLLSNAMQRYNIFLKPPNFSINFFRFLGKIIVLRRNYRTFRQIAHLYPTLYHFSLYDLSLSSIRLLYDFFTLLILYKASVQRPSEWKLNTKTIYLYYNILISENIGIFFISSPHILQSVHTTQHTNHQYFTSLNRKASDHSYMLSPIYIYIGI